MNRLRQLGRHGQLRPVCRAVAAIATLVVATTAHGYDPNEAQEQTAAQVKKRVQKDVRRWSVDGLVQSYWHMVRDEQLQDDFYQLYYLRGNYDFAGIGRVSLRFEVLKRYVADLDESGFDFRDIRLYFSRGHRFSLAGQEFGVRGYFYWTFPTSRLSRKQGNIARPTVIVALHKQFPFGLDVFVRPFARRDWHRYTSAQNPSGSGSAGAPNTRWSLGYDVLANYTFPLHKRFSFGGSVGQYWFDQHSNAAGEAGPWNSYLWWEVYAGYSILTAPVAFDTYLGVTTGDLANSGGTALYEIFDRDKTEISLSLRARY